MKEKIDILFLNPNAKKAAYGPLASSLSGIEPPVWCGLKAAFIREHGYTIDIIDAEAKNLSPDQTAEIIAKENPLLVDIVVMGQNPSCSSTPKMVAVRETVASLRLKAPHVRIMLSGIHPSALPERTLKEEDVSFVCIGEGFATTLQLIQTIKSNKNDYKIDGLWYKEKGKIISNLPACLIKNLDNIPSVAWDLLEIDEYRAHNWHCFGDLKKRKPYAAIFTSFGCPFNCTYCNIKAMYDSKPGIRFRSPEKVVEEIEMLNKKYKVKNIKFLDELFVLNETHVNEICDLIIKKDLELNIWAYARVDTVNEQILKKLKQAGVNWLAYGIEAGNKRVRDDVQKSQFGQDQIIKTIKMTRDAGVCSIGNFMFGLPEDNLETMQQTLDLAKKLKCEYANFYTVMAYPGSKLYEECVKNGARLPENWLGYAQLSKETTPLPNKYLSSEEILAFRDKAFEEYHSNKEYLKMIENKFGQAAIDHIKEMLSHKIHRDLLEK